MTAGQAPAAPAAAPLMGRVWELEGPVATDRGKRRDGRITLAFEASSIAGSGGVNRYFAAYEATADHVLRFSAMGTTLMAADPAAMRTEQAYLAALSTVSGYILDGDRLTLLADALPILSFRARPLPQGSQ